MISRFLEDFETWVDGLFGDRLSAGLVAVRAAVQRKTVPTEVTPKVQAFAASLDELRLATNAYLARVLPLREANPDLAERAERMVVAYTTLARAWEDKAATTKVSASAASSGPVSPPAGVVLRGVFGGQDTEVIGAVPVLVGLGLLTVMVGATAYAVTETGAAYAIAAKGDVDVALAQVKLQTQDLEARIAATKAGQVLPPATVGLPTMPNVAGPGEVSPLVWVGAGLATVGLLATGAWWLSSGRRR